MTTLYGIPNCDTVKKARKWLDEHGVEYRFHDLRADGVTPVLAGDWIAELGWETVVNKRSTTWKALSESQRENMDNDSAVTAIVEHPTLVKRPLLDTGRERHCGFKPDGYYQIFK